MVVILLGGGGAFSVHRQIQALNQTHFDVAAEGFESNADDRIGALTLISTALQLLLSPEGGGVTLQNLESMLDGDGAASLTATANFNALLAAFPWDGLSGMAFATQDDDGSLSVSMLPNLGGLTGDLLTQPPIVTSVMQALATGRSATSSPFTAAAFPHPLYVHVVPMSDTRVMVSFINTAALIEDAIAGTGARLVDAEVRDVGTGIVLVDTRTPGSPTAVRRQEMSLFDRRWSLLITPGPDFRWQSSIIPWMSMLAMSIFFSGLVYMIGLMTRRRNERQDQQLRVAARISEEKDRLIAAVSHELRTPLTALVGLSATLAERPDEFSPEEIADFNEMMSQQSREMALLIEDLLVAARTDAANIQVVERPVDLMAEIRQALDGLDDHGRGIEGPTGTAEAWADPLRVRQIVRNLFTNALRYGGPTITARVYVDGGSAHIEVCDDGPAIPPGRLSRIFDPYFRSSKPGGAAPSVGLGLTVSRQLARLMGGDISYRHEGGLSIFCLRLPTAPPSGQPASPLREKVGAPT